MDKPDREVLLMQANAALMRCDVPPVREQLLDRLAFLLMAVVGWWDRKVWRRYRHDERLIFLIDAGCPRCKFGQHVTVIPWMGFEHDGWRPGRYV